MVNNLHLSFLQSRVNDIRSALLFSQSKSVLKLPVSIVKAIRVDELGYVWLLVPRPKQDIREFEQQFPSQLNFFRKGMEFYLNMEGKARIILEPAEIEEMRQAVAAEDISTLSGFCFVKLEIAQAAYHEIMPETGSGIWAGLRAQLAHWLSRQAPEYKYKPVTMHSLMAEQAL